MVLECGCDCDHRPGVCDLHRRHSVTNLRRQLMNLIRDCLDKQLDDRNKRRMGGVDGIILEIEPNRPPRVAYIEVGVKTLMDRISIRLGKLTARLLKSRN